jgi:hypothetical protein
MDTMLIGDYGNHERAQFLDANPPRERVPPVV